MPWAAVGGALIGGVLAGEASKRAAKTSAGASREAIAEQRRQFDVTQEQQKPWLEAGKKALGDYGDLLDKQGDFAGQIPSNIPDNFKSGVDVPQAYRGNTNIPDAYRSPTDIPEAYSAESGNYFGNINNNVRSDFQFGRDEFNQYKDPGYDFRVDEGLKALERRNAKSGNRNSGYNTRSLMELGQNLGSQEFGRARDRAFQDYQTGVNREDQRYGRSVSDYGRRTGREAELYGRGRQRRADEMYREGEQYTRGRQGRIDQAGVEQGRFDRGRQYVNDQTRREQELYGRSLRDYGFDVSREQAQYGRGVDRYNRNFTDMANRRSALANVGQTTATNLGNLGATTSQNIGDLINKAGEYNAAGQLGAAGAYAGAIGAAGQAYTDQQNYSRYKKGAV